MKNKLILLGLLVLLLAGLAACQNTSHAPLPRSMKGYEIYSWQQDGKWHFTFITGTNRNKRIEEIVSTKDELTDEGWVNLHVTGVDKLRAIISRVPAGEFVSWVGGRIDTQNGTSDIKLEIPPQSAIEEIKTRAEKSGLEFYTP
jgi:hypothetical protein